MNVNPVNRVLVARLTLLLKLEKVKGFLKKKSCGSFFHSCGFKPVLHVHVLTVIINCNSLHNFKKYCL